MLISVTSLNTNSLLEKLIMKNKCISIPTSGFGEAVDVTPHIKDFIRNYKVTNGVVLVQVRASTAVIVLTRSQGGVEKDINEALSFFSDDQKAFHHEIMTGDKNGLAHIACSMIGGFTMVPVINSSPFLGEKHSIMLIDYDHQSASRTLFIGLLQ